MTQVNSAQAEAEVAPETIDVAPAVHGTMSENVEAVVMAIVMAVLLKYFIVEAYKIPTGSMQPTLVGDEHSQVQDRILVDKLSYCFRAPRRWEVCVFRYPLDRSKNFVKRIAGVGPEELKIQFGDIWHRQPEEEWKVLRRPRTVQESVWKRIDTAPDRQEPLWEAISTQTGVEWAIDGRNIEALGSGTAQFKSRSPFIVDDYLHGYSEVLAKLIPRAGKRSGNNMVGDLRLEGELTVLPNTRSIAIVFTESKRNYRFTLPGPAAADSAAPWIDADGFDSRVDGDGPGMLPWRLPAGKPVNFAVQNMDDLLEIMIEGEVVAAVEIDPAVVQSSRIYIEVEGEGGSLRDLRVSRDIFYTSNGTRTIEVPDGQYFMLGDNTQESCDSREWKYSVLNLAGGEELRGNLRRGENPRIIGVGDPAGPTTYFVDQWGEPHWFPNSDIQSRRATPSPFVHRDMIQGKALAVFWPIDPRRDIFRLRWVN